MSSERLAPGTCLEIAALQGHSLALGRCRSIGVDPAFELPIILAYIDGMHHFEYVLRDPSSRVLDEQLDDIVRDYVMLDPQPVPGGILERAAATAPEDALAPGLGDELRAARALLDDRHDEHEALRVDLGPINDFHRLPLPDEPPVFELASAKQRTVFGIELQLVGDSFAARRLAARLRAGSDHGSPGTLSGAVRFEAHRGWEPVDGEDRWREHQRD